MMHLKALIISIAVALVHAVVLPPVSEVCTTTTTSGHHPASTPSFLEKFGSSFATQLKAAIFKRQHEVPAGASYPGEHVVMVFIIISLALEVFILTFTVCFASYLAIRRCLKKRTEQANPERPLNPERQRADQVLNSHPPQPGDIELNVIGGRLVTQWPLPGQFLETGAAEPNLLPYNSPPSSPHNPGPENASPRPDTPLPYFTRRSSEIVIPEIHVTNTETAQESHADPSASHQAYNIYTSQAEAAETSAAGVSGRVRSFFASARYEPETSPNHTLYSSASESRVSRSSISGETTIFEADAADINAAHGIIARDWAYETR
ncbi:hypothetical protein F5Y14DRAFT_454339 [Nemania sp. NC0429]|nr:hypothetical protein F5Y14DRAFT_454339 [Nemania sp. NC0429]